MTDEELIKRLRDAPADGLGTENLCIAAADRIEALVKERDRRTEMHECAMSERDDATLYADEQKTRAERLEAALRELRHRWYLGDLQEKDFAAALPDIDTFALENSNE